MKSRLENIRLDVSERRLKVDLVTGSGRVETINADEALAVFHGEDVEGYSDLLEMKNELEKAHMIESIQKSIRFDEELVIRHKLVNYHNSVVNDLKLAYMNSGQSERNATTYRNTRMILKGVRRCCEIAGVHDHLLIGSECA